MENSSEEYPSTSTLEPPLEKLGWVKSMRFLIAGGSGFIGSYLRKCLTEAGAKVKILSREARTDQETSDYKTFLTANLREYDALINLCGQSIISLLFSPISLYQIKKSRVEPATFLVNRILETNPDILYIQASAVGIYNKRGCFTEDSNISASDPISKLVVDWEAPALKCRRSIILRFGVVIGPEAPIFHGINLIRWVPIVPYLNSSASTPWTAAEDILAAISHAIHNSILGPINVVTANEPFDEFQIKLFRHFTKAKYFLPLPTFPLIFLNPFFEHLMLRDQIVISKYRFTADLTLDEYLKSFKKVD